MNIIENLRQNRKVLSVIALMLVALVPTVFANPCPQYGEYKGQVVQWWCKDEAGTCSIFQWNYYYLRICDFWCCFDSSGAPTGWLLENCTDWVFDECCGDLGSGISNQPSCSPL